MEVGERIVGAAQAVVPRSGPVRPLPPSDRDPEEIAALEVRAPGWGRSTVAEVLDRHRARSLVVLHRGRVMFEWFAPGEDPDRRHRCYSVTKSFTGTLAATLVEEGVLTRSARVGDRLPVLAGSGFAEATGADLADMTVSMRYDEDYESADEGASHGSMRGFGDYMVALGLEPGGDDADVPRSIRAFLPTIGPGDRPHGQVFTYATPVTDVLGWMLEATTGVGYAELLGSRLWARLGAERDALLSLDPAGTPVCGGGLAVTTRDLARFGLVLADGGRHGEDQVVPVGVIDAIRAGGDPEVFHRGGTYDYLTGYSYRDQWWMPGGAGRPLSAWGIHGQLLWVDPDAGLVVASHARGRDASDERRDLEQDALCRALTVASEHWP